MAPVSHPKDNGLERHYYDACTLGIREYVVGINNSRKHGFVAFTSHLAFGEALANEILTIRQDRQKEAEQAKARMELITEMALSESLSVGGNDVNSDLLFKVLSLNPRLKVADGLNLACAITFGCKKFITTDRDMTGGGNFKAAVVALSSEYNHCALVICEK
ncbi:MAG: hypothetical protein WC408_06775 [Candidatus Micrarchaeia archaeon]|jgi:predicted nucleic acid-binding protein